jgi:hypothetical protein
MSGIPKEFYIYLAQQGYTNTCRGSDTDGHGAYVVPNVQVDSCEVKKNELYFNISYPLIKSRFDITKQRPPSTKFWDILSDSPIDYIGKHLTKNPTSTIHAIYDYTGGDEAFEQSYEYYTKGVFDEDAKVFGMDSIFSQNHSERYVTDTHIESASELNMWVNESGVFKMDDIPIPILEARSGPVTSHGVTHIPEHYSTSLTNYVIGCLIKGVGYENIEFPLNGSVSCMLKDAGVAKDAISGFYKQNQGKTSNLQTYAKQENGNKPLNNPYAIIFKGIPHPETMIGSAFITVSQYNDKELLVKIFDIKSITSGDYSKHLFGNKYPISQVRDSEKSDNRYTNTSQTYSFTVDIDFERLEKGK